MPRILLVRHGQASFGKSNYDQLSECGVRQSQLLGEHLREIAHQPADMMSGTLQRHMQTADAISRGLDKEVERALNPDWNEFDFEQIAGAYLSRHPDERPSEVHKDPRQFFALLRKALLAWAHDEVEAPGLETWQAFEQRIERALGKTTEGDEQGTRLVISSGGAISMAIGLILGLKPENVISLNLQTRNTGVSELYFKRNTIHLSSFNGVPHLMRNEHTSLITSA